MDYEPYSLNEGEWLINRNEVNLRLYHAIDTRNSFEAPVLSKVYDVIKHSWHKVLEFNTQRYSCPSVCPSACFIS